MEMNEQIIKVLDSVCEKFGIAIDWTSNNVLPYIQQLGYKIVKYDLCISIMCLVIFLIIFAGSIILSKYILKCYKNFKDSEKDTLLFEHVSFGNVPSDVGIILIIILIALFIFSMIGIRDNIMQIIQDIAFPEKTIIEFIKPYLN